MFRENTPKLIRPQGAERGFALGGFVAGPIALVSMVGDAYACYARGSSFLGVLVEPKTFMAVMYGVLEGLIGGAIAGSLVEIMLPFVVLAGLVYGLFRLVGWVASQV